MKPCLPASREALSRAEPCTAWCTGKSEGTDCEAVILSHEIRPFASLRVTVSEGLRMTLCVRLPRLRAVTPTSGKRFSIGKHFGVQARNDIWVLFLFDNWIPCLFPSLDAPQESLRILKSHVNVFGCLTGSAGLFGSGAIEDNLLLFL